MKEMQGLQSWHPRTKLATATAMAIQGILGRVDYLCSRASATGAASEGSTMATFPDCASCSIQT